MKVLMLVAFIGAFTELTEYIVGAELHERAASSYLTVDAYCQNTYGNESYLCRQQYTTGYDYVCDSLYCFDARYTGTCVFSVPPTESTLCGNGKWCEQNSCQKNSHALQTTDACPLGDSDNTNVMLGFSCEEIATKRPSLCRLDAVNKTWCCDSCSRVNTTDPATFAGPAVSADADCKALLGSSSYFCQADASYGGVYSSVCSQMKCMDPATGNCDSYPASDGVPCGAGMWCVGGSCVNSSLAPTDPKAGCFYGNKFEQFCRTNVKYPNVAQYCARYADGCCDSCNSYKNPTAPAGCEYGDLRPDVCEQHKRDETIISYCHTNEADCCSTCAKLRNSKDSSCPYGDISPSKCAALMNDTIGPGNCYSPTHLKECCETCPKFYNASNTGCEYGDHWKDYCATNVVPPNVATTCDRYESQCCGTCRKYTQTGHPGCKYGDINPKNCADLMKSDTGTSNCYNAIHRTQCCATCESVKDTSTPGCLYGDFKPAECAKLMNDSRGRGNCYDLSTRVDCCRTCGSIKNASAIGCEYGDRRQGYCETNIVDQDSAFLCFNYESECCVSCKPFKLSDHPDCKYGDKNPTNCKFLIPDEATAAAKCQDLGVQCCLTCSKFGHPGPGGPIPQDKIAALFLG